MQKQRSDIIDLETRRRERDRRVARRLALETMHIRRRFVVPRYGRAAAVLVEDREGLVLFVDPELDEIDVTIAAFGLALRFPRFDRADAIRPARIKEARRALEHQARQVGWDLPSWVNVQLLGRVP
jgi:hypothetical protein